MQLWGIGPNLAKIALQIRKVYVMMKGSSDFYKIWRGPSRATLEATPTMVHWLVKVDVSQIICTALVCIDAYTGGTISKNGNTHTRHTQDPTTTFALFISLTCVWYRPHLILHITLWQCQHFISHGLALQPSEQLIKTSSALVEPPGENHQFTTPPPYEWREQVGAHCGGKERV